MNVPQGLFGAAAPPPSEDGKQPPWLMSFADFVSCLLACFVLLFSMVSIDRAKFLRILGNVPGRQHVDVQAPQPVERAMAPDNASSGRNTTYLLALLKDSFAKDPQLATLQLTPEGEKVRIALPTDTLLAELRGGGAAKPGGLLYVIAGTLRSFPNEIMLEGKGASVADVERWGSVLLLTQMTALALEQGGIAGPIPARTDLVGTGPIRAEIVITERHAAETAH